MKAIMLMFIILISIGGCDPVITLPIDNSDLKKMDFSCGSLSIKAVKSLGPGYIISHNFILKEKIQVHFDSLQIQYKGSYVQYDVYDAISRKPIRDKNILLKDERIINIGISQNLETGDTLYVHMNGFLICQGSSVYDGELSVILK